MGRGQSANRPTTNKKQSVDAITGVTLSIDGLPGDEAKQLKAWPEPNLDTVSADVLVSDAADAFKRVIDETG